MGAPGAGAPVQPRTTDLPRQNNVVPSTPLGHYSNPLNNIVAAASRLADLPTDGESPVAVEARRARDLLQTALNQQQAYSHSREKIHSTLVQARVIADTWRTNRPCSVVHVAEIPHEGTTRLGEVLMRKMLWTMAAHVERPS